MASGIVTSNTAAQTVFTSPGNKISRITGISVDNRSGVGVVLTVEDIYTTTATIAAAAAATTAFRKRFSVPAATLYEWPDDSKSIRIFGACAILSTAIQANCDITVMWE